jgi:hypothetical protein
MRGKWFRVPGGTCLQTRKGQGSEQALWLIPRHGPEACVHIRAHTLAADLRVCVGHSSRV